MYFNQNIGNCAPGRKLVFLRFRGKRPSVAVFSREDYEGGFFGPTEIIEVPLKGRPKSPGAAWRAKQWARRQIEAATAGRAA